MATAAAPASTAGAGPPRGLVSIRVAQGGSSAVLAPPARGSRGWGWGLDADELRRGGGGDSKEVAEDKRGGGVGWGAVP